MEDFNEDITSVIVSHLPPESVLKSKLVCKTWKTYLSHKKVGILFLIGEFGDRNLHLYYGDYDDIGCSHGGDIRRTTSSSNNNDHEKFWYKTLARINHPGINKRKHDYVDNIVGSCNGLVCFRVPHDFVNDPVYICNPLTMEYVSLPRLNNKYGLIVSGFGYHDSSNKYKVVRIHYPDRFRNYDPVTKGFVQVYTLGSGTGWRNIGEITYSLFWPGTLANGSLYWLDWVEKKIVAFDLADEQFRWLSTGPTCFHGGENDATYQIKVLGGDLCLVHKLGECVDIWSFKDMRKKYNGNDDDDVEGAYKSQSWTLEYSIACVSHGHLYDPFAVTKNNEVLLWLNETSILSYDKKTGTLNQIVGEDQSFENFQGIPHMNSLISLKSLGEKSKRKARKYKESRKIQSSLKSTRQEGSLIS